MLRIKSRLKRRNVTQFPTSMVIVKTNIHYRQSLVHLYCIFIDSDINNVTFISTYEQAYRVQLPDSFRLLETVVCAVSRSCTLWCLRPTCALNLTHQYVHTVLPRIHPYHNRCFLRLRLQRICRMLHRYALRNNYKGEGVRVRGTRGRLLCYSYCWNISQSHAPGFPTRSGRVGSGSIPAQAATPWLQLCSAFPRSPHLPLQDPPLPQQVVSPFLLIPHFWHSGNVQQMICTK